LQTAIPPHRGRLLLVGDVMNFAWMAAIAIVVLALIGTRPGFQFHGHMRYPRPQLPSKRDVPNSSPGERAAIVPSAGISSS
jgi:hypothetical protein